MPNGGKIPDHAYYANGKAIGRGGLENKGIHPGYVEENQGLIIEYGDAKVLLSEYEVLVIVALEWVHVSQLSELLGTTPFIAGAEQRSMDLLYFARINNKIGKVGKHLSGIHFVDNDKSKISQDYEMLVYKKESIRELIE
ncbi:20326_t:CDS:2, partial [Cetraspora pellucida]